MALKINLKNQYGEVSENYVIDDAQEFADALPAKAGVEALSAIATPNAATQSGSYVQADVQTIATLANELKAQYNLLLAALKDT